MKIIHVVHNLPPYNAAGTEVYTYNLCRELAKKHEVFIFHRVNDLRKKEYELTHSDFNNLSVFTINNTFRLYESFESTYKNKAIAEKFGRVLDEVKPDIVHIQHLLYLSAEIIREAKKRNIPVVFTLQDYWLMCSQGQLLKCNQFSCKSVISYECVECVFNQLSIKKNVFITYYLLKKYIPGFLFQIIEDIYLSFCKLFFLNKVKSIKLIEERSDYIKNICSEIDMFIAPSQFLKDKFVDFGIPENKIIFLAYGFNLDLFQNFNKNRDGKLRFGFIGNIIPAKGIHVLIKSFNKIRNNKIELKIYGQSISYKDAFGNYLKYIKKIKKNKNIRFMGGFDNKDISRIFSEIDVLIVPSIWHENSPLVIQEAFAAKTPVIASRVGGIPELIEDSVNGLLFSDKEENDDLCGKINLLVSNPALIEKMAQRIQPPKKIEKNAEEIEAIYEKVIAKYR